LGEATLLTYLAVLAEPPPGDPLRPGLLLPRALIALLLPLGRIAAAAAAASTKPQNPKPSLEGWHKKFVKESKVRYRMVGTVWEAEVTRLHRGCAGWSARVLPQHRRRGAPLRCALVGRDREREREDSKKWVWSLDGLGLGGARAHRVKFRCTHKVFD